LAQRVRLVLSERQWKRIEKQCVGRPEDPGGTGANNRMFVEAVLWIARTGSPWRDLPEVFGKWNSVFVRFNRWSEGGVWQRLFAALADDPDFEYLARAPRRPHWPCRSCRPPGATRRPSAR